MKGPAGQVIQIYPEVFSPLNSQVDLTEFANSHQKPFKSVVSAFELALQFELLYKLLERGKIDSAYFPDFAQHELKIEDNRDFDLRAVRFVKRVLDHLRTGKETAWLKDIKRPKILANCVNEHTSGISEGSYAILIDRIDESWDGLETNVRFLSALMHACGEMTTRVRCARALLFLRENVFERVRTTDTEFARVETRVVGLDWTTEKLLEFVERRLNAPFNSKWKLGGPTWDTFFESSREAQEIVFEFCQNRPRDVLTYIKFALETGASKNHRQIQIEDLLSARKRFSDSRLKDLGDEYDENFPRIQIVLDKFYGLGWRFTRQGIESVLEALLVDNDVKSHCASWFFANATPETFVNILFQIGFLGIATAQGNAVYRSVGPKTTSTPAISSANDFLIHPMYRDALDLQDIVVNTPAADLTLGTRGLIDDVPLGLDLNTYTNQLAELEERLAQVKSGRDDASLFEDVVGDVIKLCFFRWLGNVEEKSRSYDGHVIRDWIASNRGVGGFWEMVRIRWDATQVVWECKNYTKLSADDFHQIAYYMNEEIGRFGIVVFRGEILPAYWPHLQRIAKDRKGFVLLLNDRDLNVFIRQSRAGKVKDSHIQDRYDETSRRIG